MKITLYIWILIFIYYLLVQGRDYDDSARKRFVIFGCILLTIESGFRHLDVGADTSGYYAWFYNTFNSSWANVINGLYADASDFRDPGFPIIVKLFSSIIPSWQLFILAEAIFYYYAFGRLLYRYVDNCTGVLLSFSLILALFNIIALSGARQMVAMIISMFIVPEIFKRKWKIVVPAILCGSLIHISCLFVCAFIPFVFVSDRYQHKLHLIAILVFPIVALFAKNVVYFFASQIENEYYMGYAEKESAFSVGTYVIVALLLSVFIFIFNSSIDDCKYSRPFILPAAILMTLTVPLIIQDGAMIRVSQYFTIYLTITIPLILNKVNFKNIGYLIMIAFLFYFIATSDMNYSFFWQDGNYKYSHPFIGY